MQIFSAVILSSLTILSMQDIASSFSLLDMALIGLAFVALESNTPNPFLLYTIFFSYIFNTSSSFIEIINTIILFNTNTSGFLLNCLNNYAYIHKNLPRILLFMTVCSIIQFLACHFLSKNIRRKIFHIIAFIVFLNIPASMLIPLQYFLYFLLCLSTTFIPTIAFRLFTNNKDYGKVVFSHIYFLAALIYPKIHLNDTLYTKVLISVCIMDSFASIVGIYCGKSQKSIYGFIGGQFSAYVAEYLLLKTVDFRFHLVAGILESIPCVNDNVIIPLGGVAYFYLVG